MKSHIDLRRCPDCGTRIEVPAGANAVFCKGCDNHLKVRVLVPIIEGGSHERGSNESDIR